MSWHGAYRDRVILGPLLEPLSAVSLVDDSEREFPNDQIVIGGFGPGSASQVAIWRGLLKESLSRAPSELWFDCPADFLRSFLPQSLHRNVYLSETSAWESLGPTSFGLVPGRLAILGLPTEEGLEAFLVEAAKA